VIRDLDELNKGALMLCRLEFDFRYECQNPSQMAPTLAKHLEERLEWRRYRVRSDGRRLTFRRSCLTLRSEPLNGGVLSVDPTESGVRVHGWTSRTALIWWTACYLAALLAAVAFSVYLWKGVVCILVFLGILVAFPWWMEEGNLRIFFRRRMREVVRSQEEE